VHVCVVFPTTAPVVHIATLLVWSVNVAAQPPSVNVAVSVTVWPGNEGLGSPDAPTRVPPAWAAEDAKASRTAAEAAANALDRVTEVIPLTPHIIVMRF